MPFSRGNVHIASADPLAYPQINPNFFLVDYDLKVQVAIAKWTRKFWTTEPVAALVEELSPGFGVVPVNASDEVWGDWIRSSCEFITPLLSLPATPILNFNFYFLN